MHWLTIRVLTLNTFHVHSFKASMSSSLKSIILFQCKAAKSTPINQNHRAQAHEGNLP